MTDLKRWFGINFANYFNVSSNDHIKEKIGMQKLANLFLVLVFLLGISSVARADNDWDHGRRVHGRFGRHWHNKHEFDNRHDVRIVRHVRVVNTPNGYVVIRRHVRTVDTNVPVRFRRHVEYRNRVYHRY